MRHYSGSWIAKRSDRVASYVFGHLFLLGLMEVPAGASEQMPTRFADWCSRDEQLTVAQQQTVQALLSQAGTQDCNEAEQVLTHMPFLELGHQELQDLTPLASLTHLNGLNLSFNQIQDIRPLTGLTQLSFLLLAGNQIESVDPLSDLLSLTYVVLDDNQILRTDALGGLVNLSALSLLNNPLKDKSCPVTPVTVCLFSNDAPDLFAEGENLYQQGQYQTAYETFHMALGIYLEANDVGRLGDTLNRLGDTAIHLGDYAEALEFYGEALDKRQLLQDLPGIGASLSSLAAAYERLGQYERAEEILEQALANVAAQYQDDIPLDGGLYELPKDEGILYQRLALVRTQQGEYDQALIALERAQASYGRLPEDYAGKRQGERLILDTLGVTYLLKGLPGQAQGYFESAIEVARLINDRAGEGNSLSHLASNYRAQGLGDRAILTYQQAIEILETVGDRPGTGSALTELGKTYLELGQPRRAISELLTAVDLWESLRPGLTDENKISLFETQALTYRLLQTALVADDQIEAALEMSERGRARAFAELLAARVGAAPPEDLSMSSLSIDEIRQIAVLQNATLVEYSLTEDSLLIWVISPEGVVTLRQISLDELDKEPVPTTSQGFYSSRHGAAVTTRGAFVASLVQETKVALAIDQSPFVDRGDWSASALPRQTEADRQHRKNYQLLIEPITDLLPNEPEARVIFIPHESLFLIPFPALQAADGSRLIEHHTLLTAPSIEALGLISQSTAQSTATFNGQAENLSTDEILVIGNPIMPTIAPELNQQPQILADLPGAEQEAVEIATLFNTQALLGNVATKNNVLDKMPAAKIIHLATHGLLNELDHLGLRMPGAIALAPVGNGEALDGFLTASEILDLKLTADLVVLSACNTGRGDITGDGVIGLSRSLMGAGVPSVVVSLWSVPDAPTSELMIEFYRQLNQGQDKAQALRQAMLVVAEDHPNPRDWAAFTLIGAAE